MQDPTFNRTVEALLRPERPAPAAFVRMLVIHGGTVPPLALDENEAKVVHEQLAVASGKRLDVKGAPDFDMIISDVTDNIDVLETVFRFLFVRRPPVFVLLNMFGSDPDYTENVTQKTGDMGYQVSFEWPEGSVVGLGVGTQPDVPSFETGKAEDAAWVINEAVKLAKAATK